MKKLKVNICSVEYGGTTYSVGDKLIWNWTGSPAIPVTITGFFYGDGSRLDLPAGELNICFNRCYSQNFHSLLKNMEVYKVCK